MPCLCFRLVDRPRCFSGVNVGFLASPAWFWLVRTWRGDGWRWSGAGCRGTGGSCSVVSCRSETSRISNGSSRLDSDVEELRRVIQGSKQISRHTEAEFKIDLSSHTVMIMSHSWSSSETVGIIIRNKWERLFAHSHMCVYSVLRSAFYVKWGHFAGPHNSNRLFEDVGRYGQGQVQGVRGDG